MFFVNFFINDMLFVGSIVKSRASKLEMVVIFAELARHDLKLIGNVPAFVPEEAEKFIIHVAFPEDLDEG